MKRPVISIGDKVAGPAQLQWSAATFTRAGNTAFQTDDGENEDTLLPSKFTDPLNSIHGSLSQLETTSAPEGNNLPRR